jgi:NAD(P)-dependent dehydrogenase (short-subunit alcohol dehydrogenase family)
MFSLSHVLMLQSSSMFGCTRSSCCLFVAMTKCVAACCLPAVMQVLQDKAFESKVVSATPMGRIAQPSEVASVMAFLAGPGAAFVTGQTLAVDGGYSVKGFYP